MKKSILPWIMTSCMTIGISVYSYFMINKTEILETKYRTELIRTNVLRSMNDSLNKTILNKESDYKKLKQKYNSLSTTNKNQNDGRIKPGWKVIGDEYEIYINGINISNLTMQDGFYIYKMVTNNVDKDNKILTGILKRR